MAAATQIKSSKKNRKSWRNTGASFVKLPEQSMLGRVENFSSGWLPQDHEVCFFLFSNSKTNIKIQYDSKAQIKAFVAIRGKDNSQEWLRAIQPIAQYMNEVFLCLFLISISH